MQKRTPPFQSASSPPAARKRYGISRGQGGQGQLLQASGDEETVLLRAMVLVLGTDSPAELGSDGRQFAPLCLCVCVCFEPDVVLVARCDDVTMAQDTLKRPVDQSTCVQLLVFTVPFHFFGRLLTALFPGSNLEVLYSVISTLYRLRRQVYHTDFQGYAPLSFPTCPSATLLVRDNLIKPWSSSSSSDHPPQTSSSLLPLMNDIRRPTSNVQRPKHSSDILTKTPQQHHFASVFSPPCRPRLYSIYLSIFHAL